ncbi:hypothetical protein [Streptomyces sp. NPDC093795]
MSTRIDRHSLTVSQLTRTDVFRPVNSRPPLVRRPATSGWSGAVGWMVS